MKLEAWSPDIHFYIKDCIDWFDPSKYNQQAQAWTAPQWLLAFRKRRVLHNYLIPLIAETSEDQQRHTFSCLNQSDINYMPVGIDKDSKEKPIRLSVDETENDVVSTTSLKSFMMKKRGAHVVFPKINPIIETMRYKSAVDLCIGLESKKEDIFQIVDLTEHLGAFIDKHVPKRFKADAKLTLLNSDLVDKEFLLNKQSTAFDDKRHYLNVDLNASNKDLYLAFLEWLKNARKNFPEPLPRESKTSSSPGRKQSRLDRGFYEDMANCLMIAAMDIRAWSIIRWKKNIIDTELPKYVLPEFSTLCNTEGNKIWNQRRFGDFKWLLTKDAIDHLKAVASVYPNGPAMQIPLLKDAVKVARNALGIIQGSDA